MKDKRLKGSNLIRHCGRVIAFTHEGKICIKCPECSEWVPIMEERQVLNGGKEENENNAGNERGSESRAKCLFQEMA